MKAGRDEGTAPPRKDVLQHVRRTSPCAVPARAPYQPVRRTTMLHRQLDTRNSTLATRTSNLDPWESTAGYC